MPVYRTPQTVKEIEESLTAFLPEKHHSVVHYESAILARRNGLPLYESSLLYWVLTVWHGLSNTSHIDVGTEEEFLQHASDSVCGRLLAVLPHGKLAGIGKQSGARFTDRILSLQESWPDLAVTNWSTLICNDSYPHKLPRLLYSINETSDMGAEGVDEEILASESEFQGLIKQHISSITDQASVQQFLTNRLGPMSIIFYELFKNTHDHARTWFDNQVLGSSCRGLYARFYDAQELQGNIGSLTSTQNVADRYVNRVIAQAKAKPTEDFTRLTGFLELTVFDAGPGFAQRWLKTDASDTEITSQYEAVLKCFKKGQTSIPGRGRGYGLWKVLQQIRQLRGLIRVRTNRIHAYREFVSLRDYKMDTSPDAAPVPQELLFDWDLGFTSKVKPYAPSRGTTVSILIPIGEV